MTTRHETTVAVLAGGLGQRLAAVTGDALPKVLVPVLGRPFVEWQLETLARSGATHVVLLVAHHSDQVRAHVGDGTRFGVTVDYVEDGPARLGTGGALRAALPSLPDTFWVTYGDTLLDVDLDRAGAAFASAPEPALMTVLENRDQWQPSNVLVTGDVVTAYAKDPTPAAAQHIDYGMLAFERSVFEPWADGDAFDLGDVLQALLPEPGVAAFEVTARFHDVGTADALDETEAFLREQGARA